MKRSIALALAILILVGVSLACGSTSSGGTVVSTAAATPTTPPLQVNKVGDVIQTSSTYITLNTAQITGNALQANFTIENKGSKSITVSTLMSFEAKGSDGTKLDQDIFNCPSGSLDGTVLPNDKLRGNICWTGATMDSVRIYYEPDFLGNTVIVWEVKK